MIPDKTGRYCNSCKKSVIDFTAKTDEEIQQFIINNFNQPLCGRFKNTQVQRIVIDLPKNILSIQMPLWMRFLVACLIIFGISIFPFETTIAGNTATEISFYQGEPIAAKTAYLKVRSKKRKKKKNKISYSTIPMFTIGLFSMPPVNLGLDTLPDTSFQMFVKPAPPKIDKATHVAGNNQSVPQKEIPRPTPYMPTEFILPSILLFRKENHSQTGD